MTLPRILTASVVASCLLAPIALGSNLLLDGSTTLVGDMGAPMTISIGGAPGNATILLADVSPGPATVFGHSVPLGFSPFLIVIPLGPMPAGGVMNLPALVPDLTPIEQFTLHLVAVVGDPLHPAQLDFSNGATLTLVKPPSAGAPHAVLAGNPSAIQSHGLAALDGQLLPNVVVNWTLLQKPAGSTAVIQNPTLPYPSIVADKAGDYVVQAAMSKYGKPYVDTTEIHAVSVNFTGLANGAILAADTAVSGTIAGPAGLTLEVDGQPTPLTSGAFGPLAIAFQGAPSSQLTFSIRHPDGSEVVTRPTFVHGVGAPMAGGAGSSMTAQLSAAGIAEIAEFVEAVMETIDIEPAIKALPAEELVNQTGPFGGTIFSAYADVTALSFNPAMALAQSPKTTGLDSTLVLNNLLVTVKINGKIADVPYSLTGTVTANPATFKGIVKLTPNGSLLNAAVSSPSMTLSNFALSLPGFPGASSLLTTIVNALKPYLASAMNTQLVAAIKTAVRTVYQKLASQYTAHPTPTVPAVVSATFAKVTHAASTIAFDLNSLITVGTSPPGAPPVTKYLSSPTSPPAIPAVGPSGPYKAASQFSDDYLNHWLAAGTLGGLLERAGENLQLTIGEIQQRIPALDLSEFSATLPVTVDIHGTVSPFVEPTPGGPGEMRIHVKGVEMTLNAVTATTTVRLVTLGLDGTIDVNFGIEQGGTLSIAVVQASQQLVVLESAYGDGTAFVDSTVDQLLEIGFMQKVTAVISQMLDDASYLSGLLGGLLGTLFSGIISVGDWAGSFFDFI